MTVTLSILFLVLGEPTAIEGFGPRHQPSMATCAERAERMLAYLQAQHPGLTVARIECKLERR